MGDLAKAKVFVSHSVYDTCSSSRGMMMMMMNNYDNDGDEAEDDDDEDVTKTLPRKKVFVSSSCVLSHTQTMTLGAVHLVVMIMINPEHNIAYGTGCSTNSENTEL